VVRDTAPAVREFGFDQRQEFAQSVRQKLAGIDRQIKDLASQAKSRGGAVSDRALANIRTERRALDRNLKRVDAATAANWEQIKRGVNQSVEKLNDSIDGAQPK
jgi:small-conductance mechanosensitive channel